MKLVRGSSIPGAALLVAFLLFAVGVQSGQAQTATLSNTSRSFGSVAVGTTSAAMTTRLTNSGTIALSISSIVASGDFAQTNTCGTSVAPGGNCVITTRFTPTALGVRTGNILVTDSLGTQTITLTGTGITPVTVMPTSRSFGSVAIGTTSAATTFTVRNYQTAAATLTIGLPALPFAQSGGTCTGTLNAGASCTITVTFVPTVMGAQTGSISIGFSGGGTYGSLGSPLTVTLSGTGVQPITVTPTSRSFGSVASGTTSAATTFTVRNYTTTPATLNIGSIALPFARSGGTCLASLNAGASCTIAVTFAPGTSLGLQTGTITLTPSVGTPQSVTVSGTGVVPVVVSPTTLAFSTTQRVGTPSGTQNVTLTNNQTNALTISSIVTAPSDYAQTNNCGASLAARASCRITVNFTPSVAGSIPGTLTIAHNAVGSPQIVSLTGAGAVNRVVSVAITLPSPTLPKGMIQQLTAIATYNNGTTGDVTLQSSWTSSAPTLATVSPTGLLTAVGVGGPATITAAVTGTTPVVQNTAAFTVTVPLLTSITVSPFSVSLGLNGNQQYTATGSYSDNTTADLTNAMSWTSGNTAVVGITSAGYATALGTSSVGISITASTTNAVGTILTNTAWFNALSSSPINCPTPTIDMKLLVVNTKSNAYPTMPAIQQILDYLGTPYDVVDTVDAAPTLSDGSCHGYYQGVIFAHSNDFYAISSTWGPNLTSYEITFGVRQLNWFAWPTPDFGLSYQGAPTGPTSGTFTAMAAPTFFYVNQTAPLSIPEYNTPATALTPTGGGTVIPLLVDGSGNILSAITSYSDGRQYLSQMFNSNQWEIHNLTLAYGLINWVTKGMFLGDYHVYAAAQVDDVFINDAEWVPNTPCGTASDAASLPTLRIDANDVTALVNWQKAVQSDASFSNFRLSLAFNGVGTTGDTDWTGPLPNGDTLTPALKANQLSFNWINHTYDHLEPLTGSRTQISNEVSQNNAVALRLGLTLNPINMVTPGITGLDNANAPGYLVSSGIKYVVTDTSQISKLNNGPNPSPNVGIVNSFAPGLYEVPRFPNNIFFNTATWADNRAEWNCIYQNDSTFKNYTAPGILDNISSQFLNNMLLGNMNPEMFHQTNLHFSDNSQELGLTSPHVSSLISDLYDATFNKYKQLYKLPVLSLMLDELGQAMQNRDAYNRSGATASLVWTATSSTLPPDTPPTVAISITVPGTATVPSAVVPITGLKSNGSEVYGGQNISHVTVTPGQTITLPIQ